LIWIYLSGEIYVVLLKGFEGDNEVDWEYLLWKFVKDLTDVTNKKLNLIDEKVRLRNCLWC